MKEESKTAKKEAEVRFRIVLVAPPADVDFGIQEGKGNDYTTIHMQRSKDADLTFDFSVTVKDNRDDGLPNFLGPLTHGPTTGRFIYINIGKSAGQFDSSWDRRLKVPLGGITWDMVEMIVGHADRLSSRERFEFPALKSCFTKRLANSDEPRYARHKRVVF